ncbi:aldehyde dehydrogenase family protein [Opitutia bacterium ISCC 51]|nr:aldehyde dehydrogenase family protein [Opitutae bacterium ISCC 51]QXD28527.1 aldehyde dehydrogenase family protein [Opitutae bacterium ISCC 52]
MHDALAEKLKTLGEAMTIGDGITDPTVDNGPMCTPEARAQVEAHVADAVDKGATLVSGGKAPEGESYTQGNYYLPTVITGATSEMRMMNEETFGPVVPLVPFDDLEAAIAQANDTPWGLAAYLFSQNTRSRFSKYRSQS